MCFLQEKERCAYEWSRWELMTSKLVTDVEQVEKRLENEGFALKFARIEWYELLSS